jgi:hypothetical protein
MMVSTLRTPCAADQLLIEEVRQHEVLYACPTKSNKDNQLRDTAWQEIADAVGKSGKFVLFCFFIFSDVNFYHHLLVLSAQTHICLVTLSLSLIYLCCCCFDMSGAVAVPWWWTHS